MRIVIVISIVLSAMLFSPFVCAADFSSKEDSGSVKFNFDSLPFLGDEKEEPERQGVPEEEPTEYTYDATGRKVPVRTERSGIASPIH